jgi:hypothetical protein
VPGSWHPSGRFLAFQESNPRTTLSDIMILQMDGDEASGWKPGKVVPFVNTQVREEMPSFSPDGRWIAYESFKSGGTEVYVRPFQHPGDEVLVSIRGGARPRWSKARPELLYVNLSTQQIDVVEYRGDGDNFTVGKPRPWSDQTIVQPPGARDFDIHPDGEHVAARFQPMTQTPEKRDHIVFVSNFFDQLRRIAPGK